MGCSNGGIGALADRGSRASQGPALLALSQFEVKDVRTEQEVEALKAAMAKASQPWPVMAPAR